MFETELKNLTTPNIDFHELALERQSILTKPIGSLGRLEELACPPWVRIPPPPPFIKLEDSYFNKILVDF